MNAKDVAIRLANEKGISLEKLSEISGVVAILRISDIADALALAESNARIVAAREARTVLIATAPGSFVIPPGAVVEHLDGDMTNNDPSNLRIMGRSENVPRGTSDYVNTTAKSATERALHIAVKALEKLARDLEPGPYDVAEQAEFATDELARIRTLVPDLDL